MSQEHANSYAVETGGLKELVFGNKRSQSRQELTEAVSHLQERVTLLEGTIHRDAVNTQISNDRVLESAYRAMDAASKSIVKLHTQVDKLQEEVEYLQAQVRQQNKNYTNLYGQVHGQLTHKIQGFVKEQEAFNKHSAGAIDALKDLVLQLPNVHLRTQK